MKIHLPDNIKTADCKTAKGRQHAAGGLTPRQIPKSFEKRRKL